MTAAIIGSLVAVIALLLSELVRTRHDFRLAQSAWVDTTNFVRAGALGTEISLNSALAECAQLRQLAANAQAGHREAQRAQLESLLIVRELERIHAQELTIERTRHACGALIRIMPVAQRLN